MAYGDRRGTRKDPSEYGAVDMMGLGIASALGIAVATFFDLTTSEDTSALLLFNRWLATATEALGLGNIPLYGVVLILMSIGAISILYLQPVTMRGAFAQGFGVLAAITTLAPADLGGAMPGPVSGESAPFDSVPDGDMDWTDPVVFDGMQAPVYRVPVASGAGVMAQQRPGYSLRIQITFTDGNEEDISQMIRQRQLTGRMHDETTKLSYNLFRNSGANLVVRGNQVRLVSRIPGDAPTTSLVTRIEANGYRIVESRFEASQGANPVWSIRLAKSRTPLVLQRLQRPYWF
ncbi:MAG: hypothetical protein AAF986_07820 [Pseudomonadota bacterium]